MTEQNNRNIGADNNGSAQASAAIPPQPQAAPTTQYAQHPYNQGQYGQQYYQQPSGYWQVPPVWGGYPPQMSSVPKSSAIHHGGVTKIRMTGCLVSGVLFALGAVLTFVVLGGLLSFLWGGDSEHGDFEQSVSQKILEDGDASNKIAVVDIKGIILQSGGVGICAANHVTHVLENLSRDSDVAAIVLDMDTPGGEVVAADEIYSAVMACRQAGKHVVTCMHSTAASGGYYIASASEKIVANRMTFTGSIGVIIQSINISGLGGKLGIQPVVFKSGAMKDMLSLSREMSDGEKAYVQSLVDSTFNEFAKVVAAGRARYKDAREVKEAEFGDGRVLSGERAYELGLVDILGGKEEAYDAAAELSGISNPMIVRYGVEPSFWEMLMSGLSNVTPLSKASVFKGFSLEAGKPYFIAPECAGF